MYVWVAIDVSDQVKGLRQEAECYANSIGLSSPTLTLPFHISLKISFNVPDEMTEEVTRDISDFCKSLTPFSISVKGLEQSGPILWITMQKSAELDNIHNRLDEIMYERYGVAQHEFDRDFIFHMSVLISEDDEKIGSALNVIKNANIPKMLVAKKFVIGTSRDGKAGSFSVNKEIEIC